MLKKLAALVNLVGILTATAVLVLLYRTATAVPGAVDWNLISGFVQTFWPFLATMGGLFLVTALITTMHTLFPPPPPPPPGPDPQLLATLENARLKIKDLEAEVQEGEIRQTAFQAEAARAQARVTELEGSLAHVTNELNSFKENESTLANDFQRAQERASELNTELIEAVDRRRALEAERDKLQRELGEIREDLARTQAALQTAQTAARTAAQTAAQARAEAKAEAARALLAKPAPATPMAPPPAPAPATPVAPPPPPASATPAAPAASGASVAPPLPSPPPPPAAGRVAPAAAFQILFLLQKEGRLLDFLQEDVAPYDDETLGGAIRPIHESLRQILTDRLVIAPVLAVPEGEEVDLGETVDPERIKLTGNVPAKGPYKGTLVHKGWRLKECKLPELVAGWVGDVIVPAEVEIS